MPPRGTLSGEEEEEEGGAPGARSRPPLRGVGPLPAVRAALRMMAEEPERAAPLSTIERGAQHVRGAQDGPSHFFITRGSWG